MDRNNSLFLTEVAVIAIIAAIMFPIAGWICNLLQFTGALRIITGITIVLGTIWLFNWILNSKNRKLDKKYKNQNK